MTRDQHYDPNDAANDGQGSRAVYYDKRNLGNPTYPHNKISVGGLNKCPQRQTCSRFHVLLDPLVPMRPATGCKQSLERVGEDSGEMLGQ